MKKSISNLGKVLKKTEQKEVNGSLAPLCSGGQIPCYRPGIGWSCSSRGCA